MNEYILSFDISTTNIGSALWSSDGVLIELKHLELKSNKNTNPLFRDLSKADIFHNYCLYYKERIEKELYGTVVGIIVEEPLGGSNNAKTVSLLEGFNGMCRYILRLVYDIYIHKISVHDSRKIFCNELVVKKYDKKGQMKETLSFPPNYRDDKKRYVWEKVSKMESNVVWLYDKNNKIHQKSYDMSDAYCCGYSGMRMFSLIK